MFGCSRGESGFGRCKKSPPAGENNRSCWRGGRRGKKGTVRLRKTAGSLSAEISTGCETRGLRRSALPVVSEIAASGTELIPGEQGR